MGSFIGNTTTSTMNHHNAYHEDPYQDMFLSDDFDDENILFRDDFVSGEDSDKEAPLNEQYDEHLGLERKRIDAETRPNIETFRTPMFFHQKFEPLSLLLSTE